MCFHVFGVSAPGILYVFTLLCVLFVPMVYVDFLPLFSSAFSVRLSFHLNNACSQYRRRTFFALIKGKITTLKGGRGRIGNGRPLGLRTLINAVCPAKIRDYFNLIEYTVDKTLSSVCI